MRGDEFDLELDLFDLRPGRPARWNPPPTTWSLADCPELVAALYGAADILGAEVWVRSEDGEIILAEDGKRAGIAEFER